MSMTRQPVLHTDVEATLLEELRPLWNDGMTATAIAKELGFGVQGTPYAPLKVYHVYFYRSKLGLERRRPPRFKGKTRYTVKHEEIMTPKEFITRLNEVVRPAGFHDRRKRAYIILLYWTPLRKSEIYERERDDFEVNSRERILTITLFRKKKKPTKEEPIDVPLDFPLMSEVTSWLDSGLWTNRPFDITGQAAWCWVHDVFETYYPHFFRFNYITRAFDDPETTLAEVQSKTGLTITTLNRYLMSSRRLQKKLDQRRLERLREEGVL